MSAARRWSAGDRIGKITSNVLHESRMQIIMGQAIDPDRVLGYVEALEDILEACETHDGEQTSLALAELPDTIEGLATKVTEAEEREKEAEQEHEKAIADQKQRFLDYENDVETDNVERAKVTEEWRRRAELAEHELAQTVEIASKLAEKAKQLERMLVAIRGEKPVTRTRRGPTVKKA